MKDLNDVVSYLNNVLGAHHDLTIAARQEAEKSTDDNELFQRDAAQVIFFALSGMIFEVADGNVKWTDEFLQHQTKNCIHNFFGLDEIVHELCIVEKYPAESSELMALGIEVDELIDNKELFWKIVHELERDLVSDVLYNISTS